MVSRTLSRGVNMSSILKCDRCGKFIENISEMTYLNIPIISKHIDLCRECYSDFREFINEKGFIHLFKKPFPIDSKI